jgi:hypothetical protein
MVDFQTYRYMHPDAPAAGKRLNDSLGPDKMASEKPPEDDFVLLLPPSVYGFNMLDKKWGMYQIPRTSTLKSTFLTEAL